jgi:hypothetical protein
MIKTGTHGETAVTAAVVPGQQQNNSNDAISRPQGTHLASRLVIAGFSRALNPFSHMQKLPRGTLPHPSIPAAIKSMHSLC